MEDDVNEYIEKHEIEPSDIIKIEHKTLWLPDDNRILFTIMLVYKVLGVYEK